MTPLLGKAYTKGDNTGYYVVVDKSPTHVILVGVFHSVRQGYEPYRPKSKRWRDFGRRLSREQFSREFKRLSGGFHPTVQARFDRRMFQIWEMIDGQD